MSRCPKQIARCGLFLCLVSALTEQSRGEVIALPTDLKKITINQKNLEFLVDDEGQLSFDAIRAASHWQTSESIVPSFGYTTSAYWFRFAVRNDSPVDFHGILDVQYPILDRVEFFVWDAASSSLIKHQRNGDLLPFGEREVQHRNPNLSLNVPTKATKEVYLRVQTESSMQMPLVLWQEREFWHDSLNNFAVQALYFGVMGALALYNFFIFLSYRARSYLIYVCFVVSYALFQMSLQGIGMQIFWTDSPAWNRISLPLFIGLSLFFACLFANYFLKLQRHSRFLHGLLSTCAFFAISTAAVAIFSPVSAVVRFGLVLSLPCAILCTIAGIKAWRDGNALGKYFSLAWIVFLAGTVLAALNKFGAIERNWLTESSQQIGSCVEVILLSFALAYQMNLVNREKLEAQKEALNAQEQLNRIQQQTNEQLESKVAERTHDLIQKTINLNMMLQHMKHGILMIMENGEVHQEHSASLSQLLDVNTLAGKDAIHLLFGRSNQSGDTISQVQSILNLSINSSADTFSINSGHLPREYTKTMRDGRSKTLEIDWNPIIHDERVERILVTLRDVTEVRQIKQYAEEQKKELDIVGKIIEARPQRFREFIDKCLSMLPEPDAERSTLVLRNLHTIKGNARVYGLSEVADLVHQAEECYSAESRITVAERNVAIQRVRDELQYCLRIYEEKLKNLSGHDELKAIRSLKHRLELLTARYASEAAIPTNELAGLFLYMDSFSLDEALEDVVQSVPEIARSLGKPAPRVRIFAPDLRLQGPYRQVLQDVFVHLFRNALDHGIETAEQRRLLGKSPEGIIQIHMSRDADALRIVMRDDGRGLNLTRLEQKSHSTRSRTWDEIAQTIFLAGVSTADQVTDLSGRGVGLDAVQAFLREHGGDIELQLLERNNKSACPFEFILRLPLDAAVPDLFHAQMAS